MPGRVDPALEAAVEAARAEHERACAEARRLVYSRVRPVHVDPTSLTSEQQRALDQLAQAEHEYDRLRLLRREASRAGERPAR